MPPKRKMEEGPSTSGNVKAAKSARSGSNGQDLKTRIKTVLLKCENRSTAKPAIGGLEPSLPALPQLTVDGYGVVELPVSDRTAAGLGHVLQPAPYGLGEETILDPSFRDTLQIGPDKFSIGNEEFTKVINSKVLESIRKEMGLGEAKITAKAYKLLLYNRGGHFKAHRDTEKAPGMFGTLVVQLPSVFTGGDLIVRHGGEETVVHMAQPGSATTCVFAAHYSDCEHELRTVTSGHRLALVYSLCWHGNGLTPSATSLIPRDDTVSILPGLFQEYFSNASHQPSEAAVQFCWVLRHMYTDAALQKDGVSALKGTDGGIVQSILAASEGSSGFEVCLAKASMVRHEYGECTMEYGNRGGYFWGSQGKRKRCFEFVDVDTIEKTLSDFLLLNGDTRSCRLKSESDFNAEQEVMNFTTEKAFWGTGEGECSGPSGNEGATRELWYHRWVVLLWNKSDALAVRWKGGRKKDILRQFVTMCGDSKQEEVKKQLTSLLVLKCDELSWRDISTLAEPTLQLAADIRDSHFCVQLLNFIYGAPDLPTSNVRRDDTEYTDNSDDSGNPFAFTSWQMYRSARFGGHITLSSADTAKILSLIQQYGWEVIQPSIDVLLTHATGNDLLQVGQLLCSVPNCEVQNCRQLLTRLSSVHLSESAKEHAFIPIELVARLLQEIDSLAPELLQLTLFADVNICAHVVQKLSSKTSEVYTKLQSLFEERFFKALRDSMDSPQIATGARLMFDIFSQSRRIDNAMKLCEILVSNKSAALTELLKYVTKETELVNSEWIQRMVRHRIGGAGSRAG